MENYNQMPHAGGKQMKTFEEIKGLLQRHKEKFSKQYTIIRNKPVFE